MSTDATPGAPCWIDLFTSRPRPCPSFYGELFGWTAESAGPEYGGYINFSKDGAPRRRRHAQRRRRRHARRVVGVPRRRRRRGHGRRAPTAAGGTVIVPAMAVGPLGTMAVVTDAGGAAIGMWQPGEHRGFGVQGEAGRADVVRAAHPRLRRRGGVLRDGLRLGRPRRRATRRSSATPRSARATASRPGSWTPSGFLPEGVPAHWSVYFGVADADATRGHGRRAGRHRRHAGDDTPYGRLAQLTDPTGAMFCIQQAA